MMLARKFHATDYREKHWIWVKSGEKIKELDKRLDRFFLRMVDFVPVSFVGCAAD